KIIEKQLVCQVLNVELEIHRHAFLLHQVRAYGKVQDHSWTNPPSLKINFVVQPRIESLRDELSQRRSRVDVRGHARIIASAKARIQSGTMMAVTYMKLRFVALVVVVGKIQARQKQILRILADE